MTEAQRAERRVLETRLNHIDIRSPLRFKVAIVAELRSLGWGRK